MFRTGLAVAKTNAPPERRTRAHSGTERAGSENVIAPQSQKTRSNLPVRNGSRSTLPRTSGTRACAATVSSRAFASWRPERSMPTGRAPRRASAIDQRAAPHPTSSTFFPRTLPRSWSSDSGTRNTPHDAAWRPPRIRANRRSYHGLTRSHTARLRRMWAEVARRLRGRGADRRARGMMLGRVNLADNARGPSTRRDHACRRTSRIAPPSIRTA